jgi:N6-L-threonylcarbamoyladenine synthase
LFLAIETSCDETAAALIDASGGYPVLSSNVVATQHEFHARFGGIVPEIAARRHAESLQAIIEEALRQADKEFSDLSAVAVVNGPGLIGSLVVGVAAAKAIAFSRRIPLLGINHLEAHIYAGFLSERNISPVFPILALIASGGHTHLVFMERHGHFQVVGRTRDDAAGEAFDKAGKLLGLGYPGGPALAQLAEKGREKEIVFPIADIGKRPAGPWDFSFSGLKTALVRQLQVAGDLSEKQKADLAAGFQLAVVRPLTGTALNAAETLGASTLLVVGGVAANKRLRQELELRSKALGLKLIIPSPGLCTDNAAMVGAAAYYKYPAARSDLAFDCDAGLTLSNWA